MHALLHLEGRLAGGGNAPFKVSGVHQLTPHAHLLPVAGEARHDVVPVAFVTQIVSARQEAHPPGGQKMLLHYVRKVRGQFVGAGEFVKTGI